MTEVAGGPSDPNSGVQETVPEANGADVTPPPGQPDPGKAAKPAAPADRWQPVHSAVVVKIAPRAGEKDQEVRKELIFEIGGPLSDEQLAFYCKLHTTLLTLKAVFPEGEGAAAGTGLRTAAYNGYLVRLCQVARAGLEGRGDPKVGDVLLRHLQDEILAGEAPRVKNSYMLRLGRWALYLGAPAFVAVIVMQIAADNGITIKGASLIQDFLVLWVGAMAGCWLSFGVRNPQLTLASLAQPDDDLFKPALRLMFTGMLALTLGLLLASGVVTVELGEFKTTELFAEERGTTGGAAVILLALLIGLFCGIAEQALRATINTRANQFIGDAGKAKP